MAQQEPTRITYYQNPIIFRLALGHKEFDNVKNII